MSQLYIKITQNSIAFAEKPQTETPLQYQNYPLSNAMSVAANLRVAFREGTIPCGDEVTVLTDSHTLLVPVDEYEAGDAETLYQYAYPESKGESVEAYVLPQLKSVMLYAMNRDLKTVLGDNFSSVRVMPLMAVTLEGLQQRSSRQNNRQLYCCFSDGRMTLCSFRHSRLVFLNTFSVNDIHDAVYFILGVWQQIGCTAMKDDLVMMGDIRNREALLAELKQFLRRILCE